MKTGRVILERPPKGSRSRQWVARPFLLEFAVKECLLCGVQKQLDEFYVEKRSRDGRRAACKVCVRNRDNAGRRANPDRRKKYDKEYNARPYVKAANHKWGVEHREQICIRRSVANSKRRPALAKRLAHWRTSNPAKHAAHSYVKNWSRRKGNVAPPMCALCNAPGNVHAHHPNYKEPQLVVWLCPACHRQIEAGVISADTNCISVFLF